jgi:biotin carboxylase
MKKVLILGIGNAQVDALQWLREHGEIEVHAVSNTERGRGYALADKFSLIDITDRDQVLNYCQAHGIDVVYSTGSDVAMPTASYVSEKLGLPHFVSYSTALTCNNKGLFREALKDSYGAVPFRVLSSLDEAMDLAYPVIVKPVDSQGQRGVATAHNADELAQCFAFAMQYSRSGKVIVEEKIIGDEISVNTFSRAGELEFFLPSGRIAWPQFDGGIIHKHFLPAKLSAAAQESVAKLVRETLTRLEINDGPAYFQIKMRDDKAYLIEVTPRFDGCHMWRLIKFATGADLLDVALRRLVNDDNDEAAQVPAAFSVQSACLEFLCQPPGPYTQAQAIASNAVHSEMYLAVGDEVPSMNGKMEKCGYQIYFTGDGQ